MNLLCGIAMCLAGLANGQLTSQLLKQSADTLLDPLRGKVTAATVQYARIPEASHTDLLVTRLRLSLKAQVEDNWRALNEPQRWAILRDSKPLVKIVKSFAKIKDEIKMVEERTGMRLVERQLNNLDLEGVGEQRRWISYWNSLRVLIDEIFQFYTYFKQYVEDPEAVKKNEVNDYVTAVVLTKLRESSLTAKLQRFHRTVITEQHTIFSYLFNILTKNEEHICSLVQSPSQLMYNLYNIIAITELKGYAMLQFSYMVLRINGKGNFTTESEAAKIRFENEAKEKLDSVKSILPSLSRVYRKCDPQEHIEGETYLRVKGFLQGYIENEVDMNDQGTCKSKCSEYTYTESKGCYKDMFCAKQKKCSGRIFDCEFYHADAWVCMSQDPERRYDWIEYEDGTVLGRPDQCINKIKVDSWWRWIFWHCSYCLCKCDELTKTSERFWSLLPALADVEEGKLVIGARFVKRGRIFHLQIEQAKALQEGGIDESSREWMEPDPISEVELENNPKVFTMSYEQRAMDLDALTAPEGHVLTGLKLRKLGGHLNLEIQVTPIKFRSGELLKEQSIWIANDNTPATTRPRKLMPIVLPDIPTRLIGQNAVDGEHDEYLQFDTSSSYKDVAQSTIPFIDAQPVSLSPPSWLAGAGIYHKGRVGFGGFIGLSVESYDFTRHMLPDKQSMDFKVEFVKLEGA